MFWGVKQSIHLEKELSDVFFGGQKQKVNGRLQKKETSVLVIYVFYLHTDNIR